MNECIHLDLDTWIVPGQIRKANLYHMYHMYIYICTYGKYAPASASTVRCIQCEVADAYHYLTTWPPRGTDRTGFMLLVLVL